MGEETNHGVGVGSDLQPDLAREIEFDELLGLVDAIVWMADARTLRLSYVSPSAVACLGHPLRRWLDDSWRGLLHPAERELVFSRCRAATEDGRRQQLVHRMIAADGSE